jgi:hypothetical protein
MTMKMTMTDALTAQRRQSSYCWLTALGGERNVSHRLQASANGAPASKVSRENSVGNSGLLRNAVGPKPVSSAKRWSRRRQSSAISESHEF